MMLGLKNRQGTWRGICRVENAGLKKELESSAKKNRNVQGESTGGTAMLCKA